MKRLVRLMVVLLVVVLTGGLVMAAGSQEKKAGKLKAGFIYVGPIGDYGWSHAHEMGRRYVQKKFASWLDTVYVESVPEADVARIIDRLVREEKCDVVFTTSFGYMDATIAAGKKYPDKIFMHCSGFKRAKNVGTYFAELYQIYYLNGLMAGALTKKNKVGYVGAFPIPEVIRHIDAWALGVKAVNPKAKVEVRWLFSWYDPAKAKEAAEALVADGCDALAFTEDSPSVIQVGEEHTKNGDPVYTFSHYSPMEKFGPDSAVSGQLVDWGIMYAKILQDIHNGTWTNKDMWWRVKEGAAKLGASPDHKINPKFVDKLKAIYVNTPDLGKISVYDLVMKRLAQMKESPDIFDPFVGPIKDNKGNLRLKAGQRATKQQLLNINYYVDNIVGDIPK